MAKGTGRARRTAAGQPTSGSNVQVSVQVPQDTKITVTDLKALSPQQFKEFLETIKKSQVGFVILNAPFKVNLIETA